MTCVNQLKLYYYHHTWTYHISIFWVCTVVDTETSVAAVQQWCLITKTLYIIKPDDPYSTPKTCLGKGNRVSCVIIATDTIFNTDYGNKNQRPINTQGIGRLSSFFLPLVNPSCLQTTVASLLSHWSSQTVPQWLAMHTSTLPSYARVPLTNRTDPLVHSSIAVEQTTLASSLWAQLWFPVPLCLQSLRYVSLPEQAKLSRNILPVPGLYAALPRGIAPATIMMNAVKH